MTISDFHQTFVEAFQNWSFPPEELLSYSKMVADHRPYLICITPRSGSTYLRDLLLQTHSAGRPGEFLNLTGVERSLQSVNAASGAWSTTFLQFVCGALQRQLRWGGPPGIITSYFQFLPLVQTGLDRLLFHHYRIIRLFRRQLVEQAISLYLAVETGVFHSAAGTMAQSNAGRDNVPYDAEKLRDWVRHLWFQEVGWNDYCRSRRVRAPTFFYEDLQSTPRRVVRKIMRFLELDAKRPPRPRKSRVSKLGDELNVAWARDFVAEPENVSFMRDLGIPDRRFFEPAAGGGTGSGSG